ncbi:uncharacterized protein [Dermacentor albipictus]|uniref:uncharacterized protein isoform X2 n=1 Tax=Dermacentor albipictus TaxID=60249 RepID=UPI0031FDD8AD
MADSQGASKSSPKPCWGRGTYQSMAHKLATLFAMTAGSANATQFPMMVIAYGGVPFLLAYFAFLGFVTFPAMRLESNLAQFAGDGNRGIFSTVPLFMGIGYTTTAYVVFRAVTDTMALSDALALLLSWTRSFDWHHECPGWWMTRNFSCYAILHGSMPCKLARDELTDTFRHDMSTEGLPVASGNQVLLVHSKHYKDEAEGCIPDLPDTGAPYHLRRQAVWEPGALDLLRAEPLFTIAVIWLLVFAIAHRGFLKLKTFFYAIILLHVLTTLMLLLRASTLTGATRGLRLFLQANWASVTNQEMWSNALYVSLESVGVTGTIYLSIERLNCFKNRFQEDVMFVLVADTASKGIGTIVSFLFLGHLSYATGINVHMLVDTDFNFIVSILPQAVSMVPFPELWSRIHSLWVVSMMLPKFGGAKGLAVLSNSQNSLRFFLLALEFIVILQLYGAKRLEVDSRLMTGQVPAPFVKFCWTSVIPLTLTLLLAAKMLRPFFLDRQYPVSLTALIAWVQLVEISFIPMYAFFFISSTKLSLRDCLVPLPTWVPLSWEQAMLYRQQLAAYGLDAHNFEPRPVSEQETMTVPPLSPQEQKTESSSDHLGTHLILTTEAQISPATSDWRYDSSEAQNGEPPVKFRSPPDKVIPESGTFYKSRPLSSLWRLVKSKKAEGAASPPVPRKEDARPIGALRSVARPITEATNKSTVALVATARQAEPLGTLTSFPRSDPGLVLPCASPDVAPPAAVATLDKAARSDSELFNELEFPADSAVHERLAAASPQMMHHKSSSSAVAPSTEDSKQVAKGREGADAVVKESLGPGPQVLSRLRHLLDDELVGEVGVTEPPLGEYAAQDAAPLILPPSWRSDVLPSHAGTTIPDKPESPSAVPLQAATESPKGGGPRSSQEHLLPAGSPKRAKKGKSPTRSRKQSTRSPHKADLGARKSPPLPAPGGTKDNLSPVSDASPELPPPPAKPLHHKRQHGSPSKKSRKGSSVVASPAKHRSPPKALDARSPPAAVPPISSARSPRTSKAAGSRKKTGGAAGVPSTAVVATPSPTRRTLPENKAVKSDTALVSDRNEAVASGAFLPASEVPSPSRKSPSPPGRKALHQHEHLDATVVATSSKALEKKPPSRKGAAHGRQSGERPSLAPSPTRHAENAHQLVLESPRLKAKKSKAHRATSREKAQRRAGKPAALDSSTLVALPADGYPLGTSASPPINSTTSPPLSEYDELDQEASPLETGHPLLPQERKDTVVEEPRSPDHANQPTLQDSAQLKKTAASSPAGTAPAVTLAELPEASATHTPTSQADLGAPVTAPVSAENNVGPAEGLETCEMRVEQGKDSLPKQHGLQSPNV